MSCPQSPPAFARSLEVFKKRLSLLEIEAFESTTFRELRIAVDRIQREQVQRRGNRNLNRIKPFLVVLQQYARVIEQFVSAKPDFLAFIWVASRLVDAFDSLLDAYARIGESLPVFAAVDNLFSARDHDHIEQILANVYEDILKFHSRAVIFFKQRTWTIAFKTAFRTFGDLYGDVVQNLQRSKELLVQTASVWHFQEAQDARVLITQELEARKSRDEHHRKSFVTDWLSHVPCHNRHKELRRERHLYPGSTRWIFETTQMSGWFWGSETSSLILWISGIPGAGKTFIFGSIVDEIDEKLPESQVVYFYCRYNDPLKRTFNDIVRCLIAQILALNPTCLQYLYDNMIGSIDRRSDSTNALCTEMLENLALHHEQLFIGIDGLDECQEPERRQILVTINNVLKASKTVRNVRIFLTSRKEKDIDTSLRSASRLEIRPYHLEKDIRDYVRVRVRDLSEKFLIPVEQQKTITADIAQRPHGMFLLARLIMDNLMDQDCHEDLEEELRGEVLPDGIDQAYARILDRMQKKNQPRRRWERAKLGLDILIMATRSLNIHEIQGAFAIRLEDGSIDFENRRSVTPLGELLGPIVEVYADGSVNLIHPTARDYLLQHHSGHFVNAGAAASKLALLCSSYLTFPCFSPRLDKPNIKDSVRKGDYAFQEYATSNWIYHVRSLRNHGEMVNGVDVSKLKSSTGLLHLRHLEQFPTTFHRQNVSEALNNCQRAYDMVDNICVNETGQELIPYLLHRVLEVRSILEELSPQVLKDSPLLATAYGRSLYKCPVIKCTRFHRGFASRGLRDEHLRAHERAHKCTVEGYDYLVIGFPTSAELTRHEQLCHCESLQDLTFPSVKRASISKILIDAIDRDDALAVRRSCAELSVHPIGENDFLFRAVKRKSFDAALVLLELLGSDEIYRKTKDKRTILHEAVETMHVEFLKKILSTDVDVNAEDSLGRTALLIALEHGNFDAVRLLWSRADRRPKPTTVRRNVQSWKKGFIGASSGGHEDIVGGIFSTLVEHSGDRSRGLSLTVSQALTRAASNNHESTVKTILGMGREMDLEGGYYGNALQMASSRGHDQVVQVLLDRGADVNAQTRNNDNALYTASDKGHDKVVQILLDKGADVNARGGRYSNALQAASSGGHHQVVHMLLDKGANVNAQGGKYGNALYAASSGSHHQVIQVLLDRGADVNAQGGYYGSALQVALFSDQMVRMLLDRGADLNAQGGVYGNALQAAASGGYDQVVQMLLDKGADVNAQGGKFGNALYAALSKGHDKVVQILLDKGADVDAQGACHGSNLCTTSREGYDQVVQVDRFEEV